MHVESDVLPRFFSSLGSLGSNLGGTRAATSAAFKYEATSGDKICLNLSTFKAVCAPWSFLSNAKVKVLTSSVIRFL